MPIYVYEVISDDGDGDTFEYVQNMSDDALTHHPETGQPVRRIITAPNIGGMWSDSSMAKAAGDDKKLDKLGFTKYVKSGDGYYEKRAGKGPDVIHKDKPIQPGDL